MDIAQQRAESSCSDDAITTPTDLREKKEKNTDLLLSLAAKAGQALSYEDAKLFAPQAIKNLNITNAQHLDRVLTRRLIEQVISIIPFSPDLPTIETISDPSLRKNCKNYFPDSEELILNCRQYLGALVASFAAKHAKTPTSSEVNAVLNSRGLPLLIGLEHLTGPSNAFIRHASDPSGPWQIALKKKKDRALIIDRIIREATKYQAIKGNRHTLKEFQDVSMTQYLKANPDPNYENLMLQVGSIFGQWERALNAAYRHYDQN